MYLYTKYMLKDTHTVNILAYHEEINDKMIISIDLYSFIHRVYSENNFLL